MCGRGATSACAASGRTNGVTRIAATCQPLLPHRVGGARLCQCSALLPKCSSPKPISADARRQRARRRGGVRGDSGDGWERGLGARRCSRRAAARAVSIMSRRLRATGGRGGRPAGTTEERKCQQITYRKGPRHPARRAPRPKSRPGPSPRLLARPASRRRRRCASPARCSTAAAFRGRGARLARFVGRSQFEL